MEITGIEQIFELLRELKSKISSYDRGEDTTDSFYSSIKPSKIMTGMWFRGEPMDYGETALTPSVFRKPYDEGVIFDLLPTKNEELRKLENAYDRLCHMQHYRIPTRLLDWSESILVALYFAVSDHSDQDSKLFVLNATRLNHYASLRRAPKNIHLQDSFGTKFRCLLVNSDSLNEWADKVSIGLSNFNWDHDDMNEELHKSLEFSKKSSKSDEQLQLKLFSTPIAVRPNRINDRLIFQTGLFTLHGGKIRNGSSQIGMKELKEFHDKTEIPPPIGLRALNKDFNFMKEFTIKAESKEKIKQDLLNLQIHEGTLFPELEKQIEYANLISLNDHG